MSALYREWADYYMALSRHFMRDSDMESARFYRDVSARYAELARASA